jgi:hypothetical protein
MEFLKSLPTFSVSAGQTCYNPLTWHTLSDAGATGTTTKPLTMYEGSLLELLRVYKSAMTIGLRWLILNLAYQITYFGTTLTTGIARYFPC